MVRVSRLHRGYTSETERKKIKVKNRSGQLAKK